MLIAVGNIPINRVLEGMFSVARDVTLRHEVNKGILGKWVHDDGWGAASLSNNEWEVHKSENPIFCDSAVNQLRNTSPQVFMLHARKKMGSGKGIHNTHPFQHDEFVFCHNGWVQDEIPQDHHYQLNGDTDSERLFYALLNQFDKDNPEQSIRNTLLQFKKLTGTNIILSTKEKSYIAIRENNYPKYYEMAIGTHPDFTIISSEQLPLAGVTWEPVLPGEIVTLNHTTREVTVLKPKELIPPETLLLPESL